jgi:hypothetical protein
MMQAKRNIELGLRQNAAQFSLLVVVNAFVGAMIGIERSVLPSNAVSSHSLPNVTSHCKPARQFSLSLSYSG